MKTTGMLFACVLSFVVLMAGAQNTRRSDYEAMLNDPRIATFVDYCAQHGIRLERKGKRDPARWRVAGLTNLPYGVWVQLRAFRAGESPQQMKEEERHIQQSFRLNTAAHLGIVVFPAAPSTKNLPKSGIGGTAIEQKLLKLFDDYRPANNR